MSGTDTFPLRSEDIDDIPYNHFREARWVPCYLTRGNVNPRSGREDAWARLPIVRVPYLSTTTNIDPSQLATRTQVREGYLITRAGGIPPRPSACLSSLIGNDGAYSKSG